MFSKLIKTSSLILVFSLFPVFSLADTTFPSFPMAFWGNATLNSLPLPAGTAIKAYCGSNLIGEITMIEGGMYGYNEATKNKLLVSNCDGDILFKYLPSGASEALTGSSEIKHTAGFASGTVVQKDLNFIITTPPSTAGGGSSGGVGGGGSTYIAPSTNTIVGKKDMNEDGRVDFNDFATFALIYKKTYANSDEKFENIPISWGDFNSDGRVDFDDFAIFALSYGK